VEEIGLKVGLDVGGLISGAAQGAGALRGLNREMEEALEKKDMNLYGKLGYHRDMLQANLQQFRNDTKALTADPRIQEYNALKAQGKDTSKFTSDPVFMARMGKITDVEEKLIASIIRLTEAVQKGDLEAIQNAGFGANQSFREFHQSAAEASVPDGKNKAGENALLKAVNAQQIASAVTAGVNTYVAHLDRSGIIGKQGGGDIVGANIEQLHRDASALSGAGGGVGSIVGGLLGGIIGTLINPGAGTAAGVALGSTIGGAGGSLLGIGGEAKANEMATKEAFARQWEGQSAGAMELNAVLGKYGGSRKQNTRNLRASFDSAANAANAFGFSAEEGVEAVKQGATQGLSEQDAIAAAKKVFAFERGTGADRQALTEYETRAGRFGAADGNALGWAWRGNQASGMAPAQFSEYLRSTQRIFEDGINKGFVRGSKEIAGNLTFLSTLTGKNELWKGEQGANRLSQMNAGLESAVSLSSVTDILAYRGAKNRLAEMGDEDWKKAVGDNNRDGLADITRGGDYIDAMILLEKGLTPELFKEQMELMSGAEGGSRAGTIERMRQMYGLNYAGAAQLYQSWDANKLNAGYFDSKEFAKELEKAKAAAPDADSFELDYGKVTEGFKTVMAQFGRDHFDIKLGQLPEEIAKALKANGLSDEDIQRIIDKLPFPPPAKSDEKPAPTGSARGSIENLAAVTNNPYSTRAEINAALESQGDLGMMPYKFKNILEGYFDAGSEGDESAKKKILSTFRSAAYSDENQMKAAASLLRIFELMPESVREKWNKDNSVNALANAKDIAELMDILKRLIAATGGLSEEMREGILMEIGSI
jgi:hypothetical protein